MKTPRELLLEKHQAMTPALDAVRLEALDVALHQQTVRAEELASHARRFPADFISKLWLELIWPCRRTWAGLAAVWALILAVNLNLSEGRRGFAGKPPEICLALQEQQRLLSELIEPAPVVSPESIRPPRRNPQPRSERKPIWAVG